MTAGVLPLGLDPLIAEVKGRARRRGLAVVGLRHASATDTRQLLSLLETMQARRN